MADQFDPFENLQDPNVAVAEPPLPPAPGRPAQASVPLFETPEFQDYKRNRKRAALKEEMRRVRQEPASPLSGVIGGLLHLKKGDLELAKIGTIVSGWMNRKLGLTDAAAVADRKTDEIRQEQKELEAAIDGLNMGTAARIAGGFGESFIVSSPTLVAPGAAGVKTGQTLTRMFPALANTAKGAALIERIAGGAGVVTGAGVGGTISGVSVYDEARDSYLEQGYDPETASELAKYPGWVAGAGTALITAAFGKTGIERSAFFKMPKDKFVKSALGVLRQANLEGGEEAADQLYQAVSGYLTYNPDMTPDQAITEILAAYGLGAAMGGGVEVLGQIANSSPADVKEMVDQAYPRQAEKPKTADEAAGDPTLPVEGPKQKPLRETREAGENNEEYLQRQWNKMTVDERARILGPQAAAAQIPLAQIEWSDLTEDEQTKVYDDFEMGRDVEVGAGKKVPPEFAAAVAAEAEAAGEVGTGPTAAPISGPELSPYVAQNLESATTEPRVLVDELLNAKDAEEVAALATERGFSERDVTGVGWHVGQQIGAAYNAGAVEPAETGLRLLKERQAEVSQELKRLREEGGADALVNAMPLATYQQVLREAIEAAEDTGIETSAKTALQKYPQWTPIRRDPTVTQTENAAVTERAAAEAPIPTTLSPALSEPEEALARAEAIDGLRPADRTPAQANAFAGVDRKNFTKRKWELRVMGQIAPRVARGEPLLAHQKMWLGLVRKQYPDVYALYEKFLNDLQVAPQTATQEAKDNATTPTQDLPKDENSKSPVGLKAMTKAAAQHFMHTVELLRQNVSAKAKSARHVRTQRNILKKQGKALKEYRKVFKAGEAENRRYAEFMAEAEARRLQLAETAAQAPTVAQTARKLSEDADRVGRTIRSLKGQQTRNQNRHDTLAKEAQQFLDNLWQQIGPYSPYQMRKLAEIRQQMEDYGRKVEQIKQSIKAETDRMKAYRQQASDLKAQADQTKPIDRKILRKEIKEFTNKAEKSKARKLDINGELSRLRKSLMETEKAYRKAYIDELNERSGGQVDEYLANRETVAAQYRDSADSLNNIKALLNSYGLNYAVRQSVPEHTRKFRDAETGEIEARTIPAREYMEIRQLSEYREEPDYQEVATQLSNMMWAGDPPKAVTAGIRLADNWERFKRWADEHITPQMTEIATSLMNAEKAVDNLHKQLASIGLTKQSEWSYDHGTGEFRYALDTFLHPDPNYLEWFAEINAGSSLGTEPNRVVPVPPGFGQTIAQEPDFEGETVTIPYVHPNDRPMAEGVTLNKQKGDIRWQQAFYHVNDEGAVTADKVVVVQENHAGRHYIVTIENGVVTDDVTAPVSRRAGITSSVAAVQIAREKIRGNLKGQERANVRSTLWTSDRGLQIPTVYTRTPFTVSEPPYDAYGEGTVRWTPAVRLEGIEEAIYRAATMGQLKPGMSQKDWNLAVSKAIRTLEPKVYDGYKKSKVAQVYWRQKAREVARNAVQDQILAGQIAETGRKPPTDVIARALGLSNPTYKPPRQAQRLEVAQAEYIRQALSVPRGTDPYQETVEIEETTTVKYPRTTQTLENGARVVSIEATHPLAAAVYGGDNFSRAVAYRAKEQDHVILTNNGKAAAFYVYSGQVTEEEKANFYAAIDEDPSATEYSYTVFKRSPRIAPDAGEVLQNAVEGLDIRIATHLEQSPSTATTRQMAAEAQSTITELNKTKNGRDLLLNFWDDARDFKVGKSRLVSNFMRLLKFAEFSERYGIEQGPGKVFQFTDVSVPGVFDRVPVRVDDIGGTNEEAYVRAVQQLVDKMSTAMSSKLVSAFNTTGQAFTELSYEPWKGDEGGGEIRLKKGMEDPENKVKIKELVAIADRGKKDKAYKLIQQKFTKNVDFDRMAELLGEVGVYAQLAGGRPFPAKKPKGGKQYAARPIGRIQKPKPEQDVTFEFHGEDGKTTLQTFKMPSEKFIKGTKIPYEAAVVARMFDIYANRMKEIYESIKAHHLARANAKALIARRMFAETVAIPNVQGEFRKVIIAAKNQQRNRKNQMLGRAENVIGAAQSTAGKKAEEEYLPPPDLAGIFKYRLAKKKTWNTAKFEDDPNVQFMASFVPLGKVLIKTESQLGPEGEEIEFDAETTEAYLAVEKRNDRNLGLIMVRSPRKVKTPDGKTEVRVDWRTAYTVDLENLANHGLAKPFEKSETKSGKTEGWYISAEAVNNSAWWQIADPDDKDFLSPEDFSRYYPHKLGLLPGDVVASSTWVSMREETSDADRIMTEAVSGLTTGKAGTINQKIAENAADPFAASRFNAPDPAEASLLDWLEDNLGGTEPGKAIIKKIEATEALEELDEKGIDPWKKIENEILLLNGIPLSTEAGRTAEQEELAQAITKALTAWRESKVMGSPQARGGRRTRLSTINPDLINQPAMGKVAIRDLVNAENNGLSRRSKRLANALLDVLPDAILSDVRFVITPGYEIGDDATVEYAGSFSHIHRLARVISTANSTTAAAEELAHAAALFLPEAHRSAVEEYRQRELQHLRDDPTLPDNVRNFLAHIEAQGGAITSEEFMSMLGADALIPYYHLINTDEFFAHNLTNAADRKGRSNLQKAVDKAISWVRAFIDGLRKAMRRFNAQRDGFFDEITAMFEAGDFMVTANGGFLHEVNSDSDMGSAAIAWTAGGVKRQAAEAQQLATVGPAQALTKEVRGKLIGAANVAPQEILFRMEAQRKADGRELSSPVKNLVLIKNFGDVIDTVRDVFNVPLGNLKDTLAKLPAVWLKDHAIAGASASVNYIRWKYDKVKRLREKWVKHITSPGFIKKMQAFGKQKIEVIGQDAINAVIESRINSHIALMRATLNDPNIKPDDPRAVKAAEEINLFNSYQEYSRGLAQKVEQIVAALTLTDQGNALLQNAYSTVDPRAIVKAYRDTSPPAEQLQVGNAIIQAAAYFVATEPSIRQNLASAIYQQDPAVENVIDGLSAELGTLMAEITKAPGNLFSVGKGDDLASKMMRLIRATQAASSAESKAKTLLKQRQQKLKRDINRAQMYDEAVEFFEELFADPEYAAYETEIADLAGKKHVPDNWKHVGSDPYSGVIRLPLPITSPTPTSRGPIGAFAEVRLKDNLKEWEGERKKVEQAIAEMTQWLQNQGNTETLDAKYMKMQIQYAQALLDSSLVNDIQGNHQFGFNFINSIFNKWTAMWEGIARSAPVRAVQSTRTAVRSWSDSMLLMNKWYQKWGDRLATLLFKAADSHSNIVDTRDRSRAVREWFTSVGREMFHLAQEGFELKTGDMLPDARIEITAEDMEILRQTSAATDEAYNIDVVRGRNQFIPQRTVQDEFIIGYKTERRPLQLVEFMLPRVFNVDAMNFTKQFVVEAAGHDARLRGYQFKDEAKMADLVDNHWDALVSFLSDRDQAFTPGGSPLEADAYPALLDMIRTGDINNVTEFLQTLDTFSVTEGDTAINARQQFWKDFFDLQNAVYRKAVKDTPSEQESRTQGRYIPFEQENSFTRGRGNRIAPYYWYNHGFHSTAQMMSFMLNGSSFYLNWVTDSITDSINVLETMRNEYNSKIKQLSGKHVTAAEKAKAEKEVYAQNRKLLRLNEEHIKLEDIDSTIKALKDYQNELTTVFAAEGKLIEDETLYWNRFFGLYMGGAISSFRTGVQNMLQSAIGYSAWRLQRIRGSVWKVWPQIALRTSWNLLQMTPYAAIRATYDVTPFVGKVRYWNATKEAIGVLNPQNWKKYGIATVPRQAILTLNELFSDTVQDIADGAWKRGRVYRELAERGLNNPFNTRYHLEAIAESISSMGRISFQETTKPVAASGPVDWAWKQMWNVLKVTGKGMLGAADVGMALTIRPFLPRAGDMMANQVAAESVFSAMHAIESHLRWRYANEKANGRDPRIIGQIKPVDVLPRWFRLNRKDLSALSDLKNWFQGAAVDLRGTINDFYDKLDAAGEDPKALANAKWLNDETMWNVAQQHLEDVNVATPANRPAIAKRNTINRILFALKGWRWNMFSKIMDMMGGSMQKHENLALRAWSKVNNMWYPLVAFAIGGFGGYWLLEAITRALYMAMFGEIRSVRQIEDMVASNKVSQQALINTASIVPFLDTAVNVMFNTQPSKARFNPNGIFGGLAENAFLQLGNYVTGVANTGELTYGVDRLVVTTQPTIGKLIMNRMPGATGKVEAWNASRLLIRHGDDSWLKQARFGGGMSAQFATRYTPIADRMVNEAMKNNLAGVREEFTDGITKMVMNEGIPYEEAQKRMRQMFTSRSPYARAYRMKLTPMQRNEVISRMPADDRARLQLVERKFVTAANAIGANITFEKQEAVFKATRADISRLSASRARLRAIQNRALSARRNLNIMDRSRGLLTGRRVLL